MILSEEVVTHFKRAADLSVKAGNLFVAAIAGRQCGGEAGDIIVEKALKLMKKDHFDVFDCPVDGT